MRSARCLMPARGWYEWNEQEQVKTESGRKTNQPYYFHHPDDEVLAIAGLWSHWRTPDGAAVLSCALLTKAAAPGIADIHHRMPVVLAPAQYAAWLSPTTSAQAVAALIDDARKFFVAYRVSTRVNSTRFDSVELLQPLQI